MTIHLAGMTSSVVFTEIHCDASVYGDTTPVTGSTRAATRTDQSYVRRALAGREAQMEWMKRAVKVESYARRTRGGDTIATDGSHEERESDEVSTFTLRRISLEVKYAFETERPKV